MLKYEKKKWLYDKEKKILIKWKKKFKRMVENELGVEVKLF